MQDSLVRDALLTYAAAEPPMTISSAGVLHAGRRSRRRRRLAALTGTLGAAAAVGGALALVVSGQAPPSRSPITVAGPIWTELDPSPFCAASLDPAEPVKGLPATVRNEKTGYAMPVPTEPTDHAMARLTCELTRSVRALLPTVSFQLDPGLAGAGQPLQLVPTRVFDPARPDETSPPSAMAGAVVSDGDGVGSLGFAFSPTYEAPPTAATCTGPCVLHVGPHGETVSVLTVVGSNGFKLVNIYVYSGQTTVFAYASNGVSPVASAGEAQSLDDSTVGRDDLPLTVDQLIALAATPALTLFP